MWCTVSFFHWYIYNRTKCFFIEIINTFFVSLGSLCSSTDEDSCAVETFCNTLFKCKNIDIFLSTLFRKQNKTKARGLNLFTNVVIKREITLIIREITLDLQYLIKSHKNFSLCQLYFFYPAFVFKM